MFLCVLIAATMVMPASAASTGKSYFTYLGHANDMDCLTLDSKTNLYIATMKTGSNSLVRLKVSGPKATKMGGYTLKYNGSNISVSGVAVLGKTSTHVNLLFKKGPTFYTGSVKISASSGTYADLFEIESCGICPKDGKLYFNTNQRKSSTDTNRDAVLVFKSYSY